MTNRSSNQNLSGKNANSGRRVVMIDRQPFWLPAVNFYILAAAAAIATFFIIWGILHDEADEMPWIPAGILASGVLGIAVFVREVILRSRRNRLLWAQERLDYNLNNVYRQRQLLLNENKLTLEKNTIILNEILRKSEAANILRKLPDAHLEVFELCQEYLNKSGKELETVRIGSPRLPALTQSRRQIQSLHKFHLFAWSSAESRALIQEARTSATIARKLELAAKASSIIDSAIEFYPNESQLHESSAAVKDFITTVKVSHWIEQAEKSVFKGNYKRAINHYRDALFYLARENVRSDEKDLIAKKINLEIERIRKNLIQKREISEEEN